MCSGSLQLNRTPYDLPNGCPVVVAVSADDPMFQPIVTVIRNGTPVDVTGTVTTKMTTVTALTETVTPNGSGCSVDSSYSDLPFDLHTIAITGGSIGEQLLIGDTPVAVVGAARACPPAAPIQPSEVECRVTHQDYWDCTCAVRPDAWECGGEPDDPPPDESRSDGGCSAGSPGLAVVLAVALLRRRRLVQP